VPALRIDLKRYKFEQSKEKYDFKKSINQTRAILNLVKRYQCSLEV
jgi:hypothetical protein